jgi:ABC-2 type transport system ATP-binding protein
MNLVEELCERIVLIDHGRTVLYGQLDEIRQRFSGHAVMIQTTDPLPAIPGVERVEPVNGSFKLHLAPGAKSQDLLRLLVEKDIHLDEFKIAMPTLDEIFIKVVTAESEVA